MKLNDPCDPWDALPPEDTFMTDVRAYLEKIKSSVPFDSLTNGSHYLLASLHRNYGYGRTNSYLDGFFKRCPLW